MMYVIRRILRISLLVVLFTFGQMLFFLSRTGLCYPQDNFWISLSECRLNPAASFRCSNMAKEDVRLRRNVVGKRQEHGSPARSHEIADIWPTDSIKCANTVCVLCVKHVGISQILNFIFHRKVWTVYFWIKRACTFLNDFVYFTQWNRKYD